LLMMPDDSVPFHLFRVNAARLPSFVCIVLCIAPSAEPVGA